MSNGYASCRADVISIESLQRLCPVETAAFMASLKAGDMDKFKDVFDTFCQRKQQEQDDTLPDTDEMPCPECGGALKSVAAFGEHKHNEGATEFFECKDCSSEFDDIQVRHEYADPDATIAWNALKAAFEKATTIEIWKRSSTSRDVRCDEHLTLSLGYHNPDDGDCYDDVDGGYIEVEGARTLTPAGKAFESYFTHAGWVHCG